MMSFKEVERAADSAGVTTCAAVWKRLPLALMGPMDEDTRSHLLRCDTCFDRFADEVYEHMPAVPPATSDPVCSHQDARRQHQYYFRALRRARPFSASHIASRLGVSVKQAARRKSTGVFTDSEVAALLDLPLPAIRMFLSAVPSEPVLESIVATAGYVDPEMYAASHEPPTSQGRSTHVPFTELRSKWDIARLKLSAAIFGR